MRSKLSRRMDAVVRIGIVRGLGRVAPFVVVNEFPKSGGSWLGQMLSALLGIPFPRNRMPTLRPSIMHGHYLKGWGMNRVVVIWRDGRDVMVSWYYHCLFQNERENAGLVDIVRRDLGFEDWADIRRNLPAFLEYSFTRQKHPRFSWADFVRGWSGRANTQFVRYEDLRHDAVEELERLVSEFGRGAIDRERIASVVEQFSFAKQAGRRPGQENQNSFMRKGIVGDWRNHFTTEAREVFDHYAGEELMQLGYERDHSWVLAGAQETAAPSLES